MNITVLLGIIVGSAVLALLIGLGLALILYLKKRGE